ncbi:NAD-dependent epimerase/dehydratase family protein [Belliella sp. DSM 111904]|uniref:NAD-dependent epimerase/dehydratase family protein n=1 Tax=Belliella filtrata TaxID=2923435 RepID=A0ABS9UV76_9BACT|nr:NAD-dependent epimerase/dehydratase family protein [Belliella filtrata]MCH7407974.1 NAD-dependent epimerase/dehydratase family protein [Belliella filtrata]
MKILITGATGLVGRYLIEKFKDQGEIFATKRPESIISGLDKYPITWLEADIRDYQAIEAALEGIDLVIHAAALVSYESKDADLLVKTNVEGTSNLVNAMLEKGIKKLIQISSVAALGRSPEIEIIDENHKWVESPLNTPYAISKYQADLEVWRAAQEGLDILMVYPSLVLGKITDKRSSAQIYQYVIQENKYYPEGTVNYVDVRDLSEAVYLLFKANKWGEQYIVSADAISYKDFFEKVANATGKKAPYKAINPTSLKVLLFFTKIFKALGVRKIPLNSQTAMLAQRKVKHVNHKLLQGIQLQFRKLEETLSWSTKVEQ